MEQRSRRGAYRRAARAFLQTAFGVLLSVTVFAVCGAPPVQAVWQTALMTVTAGAAAAVCAYCIRR